VNQPTGYIGTSPRIYRCKTHDYVHYDHPWTDTNTGIEYKTGFYDEAGTFYEDIVFSKQGQIMDNTTVVCRCDYCRMEDSRPWADREAPCAHCGGTMSLVSQMDDLVDDTGSLADLAYEAEDKAFNKQVLIVTLVLIIASPFILGMLSAGYYVIEAITGGDAPTESDINTDSGYEYSIPEQGLNMYLKEEDGAYVVVDGDEYTSNYINGGYKSLVLDSDGNYYDKATDMYVYYNEDIDPPQFQYWLEGLSSEYGDYGWMEYDSSEERWYIEVDNEDWQPLDERKFTAFEDRLWHIKETLI
jgi:hypothetical protein